MSVFDWISRNKGLFFFILVLVITVIVLSIYLGYAQKPINLPQANLPSAPPPPSFSSIINSSEWVWLWPTISGIPLLLIAIYNWRTIFRPDANYKITSDICSIIPGTNQFVTRVPSNYFANISFFFSYLFMNALSNYNMKSEADVDKSLIDNRQYRSAATMFVLLFVFLFLIILRYNTSNCDSMLGLILTISTFTGLGLLWYKVAEYCGAKGTDLMGISQSIISPKAKAPVVCKRNTS
jgi:hypothetical protein